MWKHHATKRHLRKLAGGADRIVVVERRTRSYRTANSTIPVVDGMRIVFTGGHPKLTRSELTGHAAALGLEVQSNVTKKTDLLIAADPESNSGKTATARRYGVPVVDADRFARTRRGDMLQGTGSTVPELKVITCPACLATWTVVATSSVSQSRRCANCM